MWIELTEDDVLTRLAGPELAAYRTAAKKEDQDDPLPATLAAVTDEVRGYVSACRENTLGPANTIPPRLKSAALDIARYRLTTRLPLKVTESRQREYENAIRLLEQVARCAFRVEDPVTGQSPGPAVQVVSASQRIARNQDLDGL